MVKLYLRMEFVQCISYKVSGYKVYIENDGVFNEVFYNKRVMGVFFVFCFFENKKEKKIL